MNEPLVSIIVPVYNVEPFCRRCFDSLLAIEYSPYDIILIDDCGSDNSGDICDEYANAYDEIEVIHHSHNSGVTQARLTGLEHAKGEYVMFVDSDDYVHSKILAEMVSSMQMHNADMVCCQLFLDYKGSIRKERRSVLGIYDTGQLESLFYDRLLWDDGIGRAGMPLYLWGKLFKRSLLEDSLQKGRGLFFGEDEVAVMDMLMTKVRKLVCIDTPLYYYVQHEDQITAKTVVDLWPEYIKVWECEEKMGVWSWEKVLPRRMWCFIKPSIYINPFSIRPSKFIRAMKGLRNAPIVRRYIFSNSQSQPSIRNHPHYVLLKYRLYWLDYLMYLMIWFSPQK